MEQINRHQQPQQAARPLQVPDVALKLFVECAPLSMAVCLSNGIHDIRMGMSGNHPLHPLFLFNGVASILKGALLPLFVVLFNNELHARGLAADRIGLAEIKAALPRNLFLIALLTAMIIAWE